MNKVQAAAKPTSKRETARKFASAPVRKTANKPKRATKKAQLIKLLSSDKGATIETLSKKLGWLAHTTRAAITRLKQGGLKIDRIPGDGGAASHYRLTESTTAEQT